MVNKPVNPQDKRESVWDYPRPPKLESFTGNIRILHEDVLLVDTNRAIKFMETSHPPNYYLPLTAFKLGLLKENRHKTFCEFKGIANYFDLLLHGRRIINFGWVYHTPNSSYQMIEGHIAVYASKADRCFVNGECVDAQEGDFYGGWITSNILGPFKGAPGTMSW